MEQRRRLNEEIDRLLCELRPDRYVVKGDNPELEPEEVADNAWLDDVADRVKPLVSEQDVRLLYARTEVGKREGRATKRANELLRRLGRDGQLFLGWMDYADYPLAVVTRITHPGEEPKRIEERVALRAVTSDDLRKFATEERRRAADEFATRNETCAAAEWLADEIDRTGSADFKAWAAAQDENEDDDSDDA